MFNLLLYGLCLNFINFFLEGRSLTFIDHTMSNSPIYIFVMVTRNQIGIKIDSCHLT